MTRSCWILNSDNLELLLLRRTTDCPLFSSFPLLTCYQPTAAPAAAAQATQTKVPAASCLHLRQQKLLLWRSLRASSHNDIYVIINSSVGKHERITRALKNRREIRNTKKNLYASCSWHSSPPQGHAKSLFLMRIVNAVLSSENFIFFMRRI